MDIKTKFFILVLLVLIVGINAVSASDIGTNNNVSYYNMSMESSNDLDYDEVLSVGLEDIHEEDYISDCHDDLLKSNDFQELLGKNESDVIVVENWDELQYYCSLKDNNYVLKLKENTSFYPTDPGDSNYQIKIYNNVKIIGSEGSYIGYNSFNAPSIKYAAFIVPDNYESSINIENVNFKWISVQYGSDGVFLQMGGKRNNVFKNCQFSYVNTLQGHSSIVYLKLGTATLDNCSFINCTTDFGCVGVYDSNSVKSTDMIVKNCYFEGNYARTEPGCINNCGKLTVYNSTFFKNRSFWWAGAIHTHGGANTTIYDSNFTDNLAGWNGGALYTYSYLQIYNTVFVGNNCTTNSGGGAIGACAYLSNPHIYIENCLFKKNENLCWGLDELSTAGTGAGGAIAFMDEGSMVVLNTTFIANSASHGTAISANAAGNYGSPNVIIKNNTFINHTRVGDVLYINLEGSTGIIEDNYFYGNSIEFSSLTLRKISENKNQAVLEISTSLTNPSYYDADILNKTLYDVYIEGEYVKTVNSNIFTVDFDDLNMFEVFVTPTISNKKSNPITVASVGSYIYVSKSSGNDLNNGILRETPVKTLKRALELLSNDSSIVILDGCYDEENFQINQDLTIIGSGDVIFTNKTSFTVNANNFTLKTIKIINLTANTFIKQNKGDLVISNCVFNNNAVSKLIDADNVVIVKSVFTNNGVVVYNNGFVNVKNSVLLNNTRIIDNNINNCILNYNWWGNTLNNLSKPSNINIDNWLSLNVTSDVDTLEYGQSSQIQFNCLLIEDNKISKYYDLPKFNLEITTINGTVNSNVANYDSKVVYTQSANGDGILTASYNDVSFSLFFDFVKTNPKLSIKTSDIMYGQKLDVTIIAPNDITDSRGTYKVSVGSYSLTKRTSNNKFSFNNLEAGDYDVTVVFSGNVKYSNQTVSCKVSVNKYDSTTDIVTSDINVGSDLTITVKTTSGATGNFTFSINNITQTLILNNSESSYTIKNIKRGDYRIVAIYNGDERYSSSQDSMFIEVDNLNPTMDISTQNIIYGETEIIKITLNEDATGNVTVIVDGVTNSSKLINGKAELTFSNIDAGFKNITVFYSGDDTYFNLTEFSNFTIDKADLTFNISSNNIKIGQVAEIIIQVAPRTSGTFTIGSDILTIPMSGLVTYDISDLEIGNYTFTAVYNGNNYKTVSNSTLFVVCEYPVPQVPNNGLNPQNTHKTGYETSTNGDVAFIIPFNGTLIGDLVIDSSGNVYLTSGSGIYCFNQTSNLWYWVSNTFEGNLSGISISRDVIIAPKSGDTLYFINQTTGERYGGSNIYQGSSLFSPVVDSNANLYIVSEYQYSSEDYKLVVIPYSLWENGGDPTLVTIGNAKPLCSPTLNDDIIVVISDNKFRIINAKTLETISLKSENFQAVRPIIGEGNIIYTVLSDSIVAYNSNGVQVWKTKVTGGVGNTLVLDPEQYVYHVNARNILYKYDLIGGSQSRVSNLKVTSGILVGEDGTLYFGSNNLFYAMDSEGNILWKSDLGSKIIGNPVMGKNGLIYVPTENSIVALTYAPLKDPEFKIVADDIVEGEKATVTITWNNLTTGVVAVSVNGEDVSVDADDGKFTKIISGLEMGYYEVSISYSGDMRFSETAMSKSFVVRSDDDVANNITFDGNSTFTFNLNNASGNLTVKINDKIYTDVLVDGQASITVDDLGPGVYEALAIYSGDDLYAGANRTFELSVPKFSVDLNETITTENVVANITVTLPVDATGNVALSVGTKKYTQKLVNGSVLIVVDDLPAGNYSAVLSYSGDSNYGSASKNIELKLVKIPVDLNEDNLVIDSPSPTPSISIQLDTPATGVLTVKVYGNEYSSNLVNGRASVIVDDLNPGNYSAEIIYSGDNKYSKASKTVNIEIPKINIKLNESNLIVDNLTVSVILNNDASGKLSVFVAGRQFSQDVERGVAEIKIEGVSPGTYNAFVEYSGDDKYVGANKTVSVTVPKIQSNMDNLTVKSDSVSVDFVNDATGILTITVNGKNYSAEVIGGVARVNLTGLAPGNYSALVKYSGDNNYTNASKFVDIEVPKIVVNLDDVSVDINEDSVLISVILPFDATGTVVVNVNGREYSAKVMNGITNVSIAGLAPGNYTANVAYSGDNNYTNASKFVDIVVPKIIVDLDDVNVDVKENMVQIVASLPVDATGTIVVKINGKEYSSNVFEGVSNINITGLAPGNYTADVIYGGDNNYTNASKIIDVIVPKIILKFNESTLSFVKHDNNVTFTFNLPVNVIGGVVVSINGENHTATLSDGSAVIEFDDLKTGNYEAFVKYTGDDNYEIITDSVRFSVSMIDVTLDESNVIVDNFTVTLKLNGDAEGNLTVTVGDTEFAQKLVGGAASVDVIGLSPGTYTATVVYSGDDKYSIADKKVVLTVPKINSSLDNLTVQSDSVSIDFVNDATGILTVNINGKEYSAKVIDGIANVSIAGLSPGNYSAVVTYSGDNNYTNASKSVSIEVPKIKINLNDVNVDINEDSVLISVSLPTDASGDVVVKVNGNEYSSNVFDGVSNINVTGLAPGNYNLTLTYSGDNNYTNASKSVSIEVPKIKINLDDVSVDVKENLVQVVVSLPVDASGVVVVNVNGNDYSSNVFEGVSNINITGLTPGNYSALIKYSGDNNYTNVSKSVSIEVPKIVVDLDDVSVDVKENLVQVVVSLPVDASGDVVVNVDGIDYSADVIGGVSNINITGLSPGNYSALVKYSGDHNYTNASKSVSIVVPKIVVGLDDVSVDVNSDSVLISVSLPADASGEVVVNVNGDEYSSNVFDGVSNINVTGLAPGNYNLTLTYSGDNNYTNASKSVSIEVPKIKINLDDVSVDVRENLVRVVVSLPVDASGVVVVNVNGNEYSSNVFDGVSNINITGLTPGNYSAVVTYSGDNNYTNASNVIGWEIPKVKVVLDNNTLVVNSTDNSLSCSISLPGDATGTLTVSVDGKEYSQRLVNGKATVTIPELSEGTHNVTVSYSGDGKYDSVSNSTIVECEPVKEVSNVTITVPGGVKVGESVKITVDIANATGNVTVIVDNKETVMSLVNGSVNVILDDISSGDHGVVVIYLGDETHAPVHAASSFSVAALPEKVDSGFVDILIIDKVVILVLKDANGNAISGANVSYAVNGASSSVVTGGDGSFSIIGDYGVVISVDYAGDNNYHPTNTVIKFEKIASALRQSTVVVGSNFTQYALDYSSGERGQNFTVQLKDANGNVLANKTVLIGYNGKTLYRTTDADGYASVQINLRDANRLTFAVSFLGDEDYNATMSVYLVTVNKKPVTIAAAAKTYKATAKTKKYTVTLKTIRGSSVDGKTYFGAGKKVVLKINGKTYSAKTNAKGQATFSLKITKKGKYSAFISYAGDNTYKSTTKTVKINIK